jgi:hypothetical protein
MGYSTAGDPTLGGPALGAATAGPKTAGAAADIAFTTGSSFGGKWNSARSSLRVSV